MSGSCIRCDGLERPTLRAKSVEVPEDHRGPQIAAAVDLALSGCTPNA